VGVVRRGGDRQFLWFVGVRNDRGGAADGWESAVFVSATGWESAVSGRSTGWGSMHRGAARSAGPRGVGGRAGRHRHRRLDDHQTLCGDSGQPLPRHDPWWHPASALPALMAPRIPTTHLDGTSQRRHARIGVGAVQNRRRYHRVISTVCGDAGRPAHQRPETPRCARHHRASIRTRLRPHRASIRTRLRPHRASIRTRPAHQRPETPRCARHHHDRFAPVCGPTARRFAPGPNAHVPESRAVTRFCIPTRRTSARSAGL
jgi:hypothetical protein